MGNPKVFSLFVDKNYEDLFRNVRTIGKKVDFFIECMSYDVILHVKSKIDKKLDIFEDAILKLIEYGYFKPKDIAEILALTPDLVNFIIIRLKDMGLLSDNKMNLTENGEKYLDINNKTDNIDDIKKEKVKFFALKGTGEILPYVHIGEFITEPLEYPIGSNISVYYGTAGNDTLIKGEILKDKSEYKMKQQLDTSEVRNILDKYNQFAKNEEKFDTVDYEYNWAIDSSLSETVYFHIQSIIQYGNSDELLFSDGFVPDIDFIRRYIKKNYPEFIHRVKSNSAINEVIKKNDFELNKESIDLDTKEIKYKELRIIMKELENYSEIYTDDESIDGVNKDEAKRLEAKQKRFLLICYSAFEWSLYYYDLENKLNNEIRHSIKLKTAKENKNLIIKMAEKIGVKRPERYEILFNNLNDKRIRGLYKYDTPELRSALSIAIITSGYKENSKFIKLFRNSPDLFKILSNLQKGHGKLAHKTETDEINIFENKKVYTLLKEFIKYLQPDFESKAESKIYSEDDCISQERINADVSLANKLGITYYNSLPDTIKEEWILVSPDKDKYPTPANYSDILARIMQDTLMYKISEKRKNIELNKEDILKRLKSKGIQSDQFETINNKYVKETLKNGKPTLGANAIVFLYYQSDANIKILKENDFVYTIEKLISYRKHGNNVADLTVSIEELNNIRDDILKLSKIIGGM